MEEKEIYITQKIHDRYVEKRETKLDRLKQLDKKVKKPAQIMAYTQGIIFSLILGVGMCMAMNVIGSGTAILAGGIVVGVVGIVLCAVNHLIYKKVLLSRKKKYSKEIVELSNEILNND